MNVPIAPSAALPPFPPSKKGALPTGASTVIEALGGLKRLKRARGIAGLAHQGSHHLAGIPNHSNHRDMPSRYATVMPPRIAAPLSHPAGVNFANVSMMHASRHPGRPVRSHPEVNTEAMHGGGEGTVVTRLSPHNGADDASQGLVPSRLNSSLRLGTPVTASSTEMLVTYVDAMSWCAAGEEMSTSHRSRNRYESGGPGVDSQREVHSARIEETSRPIPDQYPTISHHLPNVRSHHGLADFGRRISGRERAATGTSQANPVVANQALAAQARCMLSGNMQGTSTRASIRTNDCERPQHATEVGFVSGDTDMIVMRDRSTIQTRTTATNDTASFVRTGDRSATRGNWSSGNGIQNLANNSSPHREYDCFRKQVVEIPRRPKRGRKRGLPQFPAHRANLERTAKRPRATIPTRVTQALAGEEMVVCMDIVEDTSPQTVPSFPLMEISSSMGEEREVTPSTPELNALDTSMTPESWTSIITPGDDMHDIPIWIEDNGVEEPVMHARKRSHDAFREGGEHDPTEGDVMHGVSSGVLEDGNVRKRVRNGFREAGEDGMWEIPSASEEEYCVRGRERNAYRGAEEYYPMRRDVMRDLTSESEQDSDPEWDPDAIRGAKVHDSTDEEEDMHDKTTASVQDVSRQRGQYTCREAEVSDSSDVMHIVTSRSDADSMEGVMHARTRVQNSRKARVSEQNTFRSRKRRLRFEDPPAKRRHTLIEISEPMSIC